MSVGNPITNLPMHISRVNQVTDELVIAFEGLIPQLTRRQPPTFEDLNALIASPSILLIARYPDQTGRIVGSGTLGVFRTPTGQHAHIEDVVVDLQSRGLGIGEALVNHLLEIAREKGLEGVSLTCNPERKAANHLYVKMGFEKWNTNVYWYDLK
jgi:ribosomal protein S18 acetylase RimI-like enzyme